MANELKASLTIDVTPFLNGIRNAASQGQGIIAKLFSGSSAPKVDVDTAPAVDSLKRLETQSEKTGGILGNISKIAAGFGLAAVAVGVAKVGSAMVTGNAEMETYKTQLGTLLGGADKAQERLAELAKFGAETPFDLPELVKAEKVLIGFGLQGEKALKMTGKSGEQLRTVIGDISAGVGVPFEELAVTFGKFSAGASGEAISRLQELGIVTKEQLNNVGIQFDKAGSLVSPLPEAMTAAVKIAEEKFGGGMDALSKTFSGRVSTLKDTITQGLNFVGAPLFEGLGAGLEALNKELSSPAFTESLGKFGSAFASLVVPVMQLLPTLIGPVISIFSSMATSLSPLLSVLGEALAPILAQLSELAGPLVGLVTPIAGILATALKSLLPILSPVINFFVRFAEILGKVFEKLAGPINEVLGLLGGVVGDLVNTVLDALLEALDAIGPLLPVIVELFVSLLKALLPMTTSVLPLLNVALKIVAGLLNALSPILGAVIKAVAGLADILGVVTGAVGSVIEGIGGFFSGLLGGLDETDKRLAAIEKRAADAAALQTKQLNERNAGKFEGIVKSLIQKIEAGTQTNEQAAKAIENIFENARLRGDDLSALADEKAKALERIAAAVKAPVTTTTTGGAGAPDAEAEKKRKAEEAKRKKEAEEREKRHQKLLAEIVKAGQDERVAAVDDEVKRSLDAYDLKRERELTALTTEYGEFAEFVQRKAIFDTETTRERTALEAKLRKDAADKRLAEQEKEDRRAIDAMKNQQAAIIGETADAMQRRLDIQKDINAKERALLATPEDQERFDLTAAAETAKSEAAIRRQVKLDAIAQERDLDLQAHKLRLLEIDERLNIELEANKLNESKKLEAIRTAAKERLAVEEEYRLKTDRMYAAGVALRETLLQSLNGVFSVEGDKRVAEERKHLADELRALEEQKAAKKISDDDYRRQKGVLDAKQDEFNKQHGAESAKFFEQLRVAGVKLAARISEGANKQLAEDAAKAQKKIAEGEKLTVDERNKLFVSAGTAMLGKLGEVAAAGQLLTKEGANAILSTAATTLKALVNVYAAEIFGSALAFLGPIAGPIAAGLAMLALNVLEDVAIRGLGITPARHGERYVPGNPAEGDSRLYLLQPGEGVLTVEENAAWRPWIDRGLRAIQAPMPDMGKVVAMLAPAYGTANVALHQSTQAIAAVGLVAAGVDTLSNQTSVTNLKLQSIEKSNRAIADTNREMANQKPPRRRSIFT